MASGLVVYGTGGIAVTDEVAPYVYCGKHLSDYSLWELATIEKSLLDAEARRDEASKHVKFNKATNKKAMEFPPPNPEFLKLKSAIEVEIRNRQNV
jgi:hypothetical protein